MTAYRLIHTPTGNLLRTPFSSATAALLFGMEHLPFLAAELDAVPVSDLVPDEDATYDTALSLLVHGDRYDAGRYLECPGPDCGALVHHADRHAHAKSCGSLRSLAARVS